MEQTPSSPGRSPELPSVSPPSSGETIGAGGRHEQLEGGYSERKEQRGEAASDAEQAATSPVVPYTPVVSAPPADDQSVAGQPVTDSPSVASDDDLIEKEWVEKAKKIITATKDDPYKREQEVSRLQADYLQKRYGRSVGSTQ